MKNPQKWQNALKPCATARPTDIYEAMQLIFIYFIISECVDSFQVRSLGNGLDRTLYRFYENDLKTGRYSRDEIRSFLAYFLLQWSAIGNYWGSRFIWAEQIRTAAQNITTFLMIFLMFTMSLGYTIQKSSLKSTATHPERLLNKAFDMCAAKTQALFFAVSRE